MEKNSIPWNSVERSPFWVSRHKALVIIYMVEFKIVARKTPWLQRPDICFYELNAVGEIWGLFDKELYGNSRMEPQSVSFRITRSALQPVSRSLPIKAGWP